MKVCILKETGELIEMQSNATDGTLIQNALQYGYLAEELEEKEVTEEEYQQILDKQPELPQPPNLEERLQQAEDTILFLLMGGM